MTGLTQILGPASETYAGFAWNYLRRNLAYERSYTQIDSHRNRILSYEQSLFRFANDHDKLAHGWGLECFESPENTGLEAEVFWRQDAFPGALSVQYHSENHFGNVMELFNLAEFNCLKQHYIKPDGRRISVLKSQNFWLQIAGQPTSVETEREPFTVIMDGGNGARRRIDALRQLTSLKRDGADDFKLLGRERAFIKLRNGLLAYDIKATGGSYKDVAIALFGAEHVATEWNPTGCFLKARAIRAFKFGERMVSQDYQSLLPKKTL